jgi:hypothetical protein
MATQPMLEYLFTGKLKSGSRGRGKVGWRFCEGEARLSGESDGLTGGSILPGVFDGLWPKKARQF